MVDARISRLDAIPADSPIDRRARDFGAELAFRWQQIKREILTAPAELLEEIPQEMRCISPSDFGFHNALLRPTGELCFLDFEYAGWDDPAKTIADFFAHPGLAVPRGHFDAFMQRASRPFASRQRFVQRARLLEPAFRAKWCCIILNEFLPSAARRRKFADPGTNIAERKRVQLEKARALFESLIP